MANFPKTFIGSPVPPSRDFDAAMAQQNIYAIRENLHMSRVRSYLHAIIGRALYFSPTGPRLTHAQWQSAPKRSVT